MGARTTSQDSPNISNTCNVHAAQPNEVDMRSADEQVEFPRLRGGCNKRSLIGLPQRRSVAENAHVTAETSVSAG